MPDLDSPNSPRHRQWLLVDLPRAFLGSNKSTLGIDRLQRRRRAQNVDQRKIFLWIPCPLRGLIPSEKRLCTVLRRAANIGVEGQNRRISGPLRDFLPRTFIDFFWSMTSQLSIRTVEPALSHTCGKA
ncbi:hypothetical protein K443DRAFT_551277 [Laccaria amethystina LaAM-08-1]|uniref:Uncharacterized protein n=1 Tax=Laccaria amethystina LaAM-08-1 TaxID=1095629 RepID=A0A0C9WSG1_9AGAR|nr:hypothetical protein K443DRAFT_551277 [Laccaria amethystina LaAM-08-1]